MATSNQVLLDPKALPLSNQPQDEQNTPINPAFRNLLKTGFLRDAMSRKIGDTGWEDVINIANLGFNHFDKNLDHKITIADLKLYSPNISVQLTKIEQGAKEADFNKDGKTDNEDIFKLWTDNNLPNLDLLKQAYGKTSQDAGWEDKTELVKLGFKNADVNLDNVVNELDKAIIFSAIFPDGTLVRDSVDNRFMIVAGTKKRIQDEKTFENLGLDKSQMTTLSDEELEIIPAGEEIPQIKYDNGTLIKAGNDYYLMAFGLRRKIPDDLTLQNLDLDKTKAVEISATDLNSIPEGSKMPHFEYPIGTILKNAETNDEQYYLITPQGEKKLIPDTKTLENLGLDTSKVKSVDSSKLAGIPTDLEPFPHLEYPNGSILKSGDKYYSTMMDKKIEVPDAMTLQAYGLDVQPYTVTVRAMGTQSGGSYPLIQLRVDGQVVKEWFVTDQYKDYSVTVPLSSGNHKIDVVYPNDQDTYTWINTWVTKEGEWYNRKYVTHEQSVHNVTADRELNIDYITLSNNINKGNIQKIEAEDYTQVKYDRASNQDITGALDGEGVEAGKEKMDTAGALRFNLQIDNVIPATDKALNDLPTIMTLDKVKYPNRTVLKDSEGNLYTTEVGSLQKIQKQEDIDTLGLNVKEHTFTIRAKAEAKDGIYPHLKLQIDGKVVREWTITDEYKDYTITLPLKDGKPKIEILYGDDGTEIIKHQNSFFSKLTKFPERFLSPNLYIDSLKIDSQLIEAEDANSVKYYRGIIPTSDNPEDSPKDLSLQKIMTLVKGKTVVKGKTDNTFKKSEPPQEMILNQTGYLEINPQINTMINISDSELSNMKTGEPINIKYPNDEVLEDEKGNRYLMSRGIRSFIPNQDTYESLGLNNREHTVTIRAKGIKEKKPYQAGIKLNMTEEIHKIENSDLTMKLRVDDEIVKEWTLTDQYKDYTFSLPLLDGNHKVDLVFPDVGQAICTSKSGFRVEENMVERSAFVDYIMLDDKTVQTENPAVKYDRGSLLNEKESINRWKIKRNQESIYEAFFDGKDVVAGQEKINKTGALRFAVEATPKKLPGALLLFKE